MAAWLATHWQEFFVDSIAAASFETQVLMLHSNPYRQNHTMGDTCLRLFRRNVVILPTPASRSGWDHNHWPYA